MPLDPVFGEQAPCSDFSSFAAMTVMTGLSCALAYGSAFRKIDANLFELHGDALRPSFARRC